VVGKKAEEVKRRVFIGIVFCIGVLFAVAPAYAQSVKLTSVNLERAGNTGQVSVLIDGAYFNKDTTFELRDSNGALRTTVRETVLDWNQAIATFDLNGAPGGGTKLKVKKEVLSGTEEDEINAFLIEDGLEGELRIHLEAPGEVRPVDTALLLVQFRNEGFVDIPIPVLILDAPGATFLSREKDGKDLGQRAFIMAIPQTPYWPAIRPGESGAVPMYLKVPADTELKLIAADIEDPEFRAAAFDYSQAYGGGSTTPPEWVEPIAFAKNNLGENLAEYYEKATEAVEEMSSNPATQRALLFMENVDGEWVLEGGEPQIETTKPSPTGVMPSLQPQSDGGRSEKEIRTGDGIPRVWVVIIADEDYSRPTKLSDLYDVPPEVDRQIGVDELSGTQDDAKHVRSMFQNDFLVPDEQIVVLKDEYEWRQYQDNGTDSYAMTPQDVDNSIRGLKGKVDGDDNVVIWYSGHGLGPDYGEYDCKYPAGTWALNGGGAYTPENLSAALEDVGAGANYVYSDSCYSGAFIDEIDSKNTAAFSACSDYQLSSEGVNGGFFTYTYIGMMLKNGGNLYTSFEDTRNVTDREQEKTGIIFLERQAPKTNSINDEYSGFVVDVSWAFGDLKGEFGQIVGDGTNYVNPDNVDDRALVTRSLTVGAQILASDYVPGGFAVCPWSKVFYVTDNSIGRIMMIDTYQEEKHQRLPLIGGINSPGDIDLWSDGRGFVYTDGDRVKSKFFGFTVNLADSLDRPLSGAEVTVQGPFGIMHKRTEPSGYLTVLDLLSPALSNRQIMLSVEYLAGKQTFVFELDPTCHTFKRLIFDGDGKIKKPEKDEKPIPPPPPPVPVTTTGGGTSGGPPPEEPPLEIKIPVTPGMTSSVICRLLRAGLNKSSTVR